MKKQKKFFFGWVWGFLLLILFFPQSNLLAAADPCAAEDCKDTCPSEKPYEVSSQTCNEMGLFCCSAVTDMVTINGKDDKDDDETDASDNCDSVTSEGLEGGFLFFKGSVVPCGRSCDVAETEEDESASCTLCHFILLAKNIYDLLFAMVIFASILMITIGGTVYMISSGNHTMAGVGKALITKTLAGFALFILGELIVVTVLNFVGANLGVINESGSFFKFTCDTESTFNESNESSDGGSDPDSGGEISSSCPTGKGECSIASLKNTCLKNNAEKMSIICQKESGGSLTAVSGTDKCKDGSSFSFGLFQINLIANAEKIGYKSSDIYEINSVEGTLHNSTIYGQCLKWQETASGGYCAIRDCKVIDNVKYEAAKKKLFEKGTNISIACQISNNGYNLSPWSYSKKECGL